jgi:hypothetical protein
VDVKVGEPIDVRALVGEWEAPPPAAIRAASDEVMATLVQLIAELRDELPEHPSGVPAGELATG